MKIKIVISIVVLIMVGCSDQPDLNTSNNLSIYPNPVSDYFNIDVQIQSEATLQVFDTKGKIMLNESLIPGNFQIPVELINKPSGTYHVTLQIKSETITEKVIKI